MNKVCATCKHGSKVEGVERVIECRIVPPQAWPVVMPTIGESFEMRGVFPVMEPEDWCSQWNDK